MSKYDALDGALSPGHKVVAALARTPELQAQLDVVAADAGGWPLK